MLGALGKAGFEVALSGIDEAPAHHLWRSLGHGPERFLAARLLDPTEILSRAKLTVCHGGSGTVYQSLAAGVPLLCVPENPDQGLVALDVQRSGAGRVLEAWRCTPQRAQSEIELLVASNRYSQAARRMAETIEQRDTRGRWLQFLSEATTRVKQEAVA